MVRCQVGGNVSRSTYVPQSSCCFGFTRETMFHTSTFSGQTLRGTVRHYAGLIPVVPSSLMELLTENRNVTYAHPVAAFFHCAFKVAAILTYLLCGLFSASYVINFVITIALLAIDFWIVKNVTGRLLVGLRWWNDVDELGASTWKFESLDQQALDRVNRNDSWIFWWPLYMNSAAWIVLAIIAIIRFNFDYFVITIIAITLTSANTAGYSKCRKDAERRSRTLGQGFASNLFQAALGVRSMTLWVPGEKHDFVTKQ